MLQSDYQPRLLTVAGEKTALLRATGIDDLALLHFTVEMSRLSAHDFMQMLHDRYGVAVLLIGYDHRFGAGRTDTFADYVRHGREIGIEVIQAREAEDGRFSSTIVRRALAEGDVAAAADVLGYNYFLEGEVVHGFHNGTQMGFPTANLRLPSDKLIPRSGVYSVSVTIADGTQHDGMLNIGTRPTLDNGEMLSVETNIFGFSGDLYGTRMRVELLRFIRPERRFASLDELRQQLERDKQECTGR